MRLPNSSKVRAELNVHELVVAVLLHTTWYNVTSGLNVHELVVAVLLHTTWYNVTSGLNVHELVVASCASAHHLAQC